MVQNETEVISAEIVEKFMKSTKIPETKDGNVKKIMQFLTKPQSVNVMISMSEMGFPALSGVVRELEERFAYSDFPLHHDAEDQNAPNRRNIGWMVRFVMREFGYEPIRTKVQPRIGVFSGSKHFSTAATYKNTNGVPNYSIQLSFVDNERQ